MLKNGESNRAFGKRCGISEGSVRNLEAGKDVSLFVLKKVADACNVQIGWLTGDGVIDITAHQSAGANAGQAIHNSKVEIVHNETDGISLSPLEQEIISLIRELGPVAARGVKWMLEKRIEEEKAAWDR